MSSSKSTHMLSPPSTSSRKSHPRKSPDYYPNYPSFFTPNMEASRYDPNFMLRYGSLNFPKSDQKFPRSTDNYPRGAEKYPKLYPEFPRSEQNIPRSDSKNSRSKKSEYFLDPQFLPSPGGPPSPGVHRGAATKGEEWYIPRANLWCYHKGYAAEMCTECKAGGGVWKSQGNGAAQENNDKRVGPSEEIASICSSVNPPPTFTALDNYRPIRARQSCRHCSCGIIFAITTIFSLLVLVLIAGFIIYVETVLKHQTANAMDRM